MTQFVQLVRRRGSMKVALQVEAQEIIEAAALQGFRFEQYHRLGGVVIIDLDS